MNLKTTPILLLVVLTISGCTGPPEGAVQEQSDGTSAGLPIEVSLTVDRPERMYQSAGTKVLVTVHATSGDVGDVWAGLTVPPGVEVLSGDNRRGPVPSGEPIELQYQVRASEGAHILTAWAEDFTLMGGRTVHSQGLRIEGDARQATVAAEDPAPIDFRVTWELDDQDPLVFRVTMSSPVEVPVRVEASAPTGFVQGEATWSGSVQAGSPQTLSFRASDERPGQDGTYPVSVLVMPHPGLDPRLHSVNFCYVYEGDSVRADTSSPGCRTPEAPSSQGNAQQGSEEPSSDTE